MYYIICIKMRGLEKWYAFSSLRYIYVAIFQACTGNYEECIGNYHSHLVVWDQTTPLVTSSWPDARCPL